MRWILLGALIVGVVILAVYLLTPATGFKPTSELLQVRDAALEYVADQHGVTELQTLKGWEVQRLTPQGLADWEIWQFSEEGVTVRVRWTTAREPEYKITIRAVSPKWLLWNGIVHDDKIEEIGWVEGSTSLGPSWARDRAIEYFGKTHPGAEISADLAWKEDRITPEGVMGREVYRYKSEMWQIDVSWSVIPIPDYQVQIFHSMGHFYWEGIVHPTGAVEVAPAISLEGKVLVDGEGTRSESWGIHVLKGPAKYIGADIGLESFAAMKDQFKRHKGRTIRVTVSRVCPSWTEGCCASLFDLCAERVLFWKLID